MHVVHEYAHKVVNGEIIACKKLIKACQRHLDDLAKGDYYFDEAAADKVVLFAEQFKHVQGRWDNPYLTLEPWQKFVLGNIFGWKNKQTGYRRFRTAYIQIPRKNGKSTIASIVGLYMLVIDKEPGAQVYSAATTRDQARIVFEVSKAMVRNEPDLRKRLGINKNNIDDLESQSYYRPLSRDSSTMDGFNVHCALIDELHAHKDGSVYGVLDTATGSREQSLIFMITTAGYERAICIEQYDYSDNILNNVLQDDQYFVFITELDEEDDWTNPESWKKANPNLGASFKESYLQGKLVKAMNIAREQNEFLCKHLNKWVNQSNRWLNLEQWKACGSLYNEKALEGRKCYGGLDVSATQDVSAFVLMFPPLKENEPWKALYRFWVPEGHIHRRSTGKGAIKTPFDIWVRDGWMLTTPGDVIDQDFIQAEILELKGRYDIQDIGFDEWNSSQLAKKLMAEGAEMTKYRQGPRSFNEPMKRFEDLLLEQKFRHGNHPPMTWMANNMVVRTDSNTNMAPDKDKAKDKIDGMVALLMALGLAIRDEQEDTTSVYEQRGIMIL